MAKISVREQLTPFLVTDEDGSVNLKASTEKFSQTALAFFAAQEANDSLIRSCLTALYDTMRGASFNQQYIASSVIRLMSVSKPELAAASVHSSLSKRIVEVLQADTKVGIYANKKGPTGGTFRVCDQAPEAVAAPVVTQ